MAYGLEDARIALFDTLGTQDGWGPNGLGLEPL